MDIGYVAALATPGLWVTSTVSQVAASRSFSRNAIYLDRLAKWTRYIGIASAVVGLAANVWKYKKETDPERKKKNVMVIVGDVVTVAAAGLLIFINRKGVSGINEATLITSGVLLASGVGLKLIGE
ncbi:MAG: hypothetical protein HYW02_02060 [Deltaproteobacteria bacterium]|nr:hypothetical protein [Deltaproteobacteria bacterium]